MMKYAEMKESLRKNLTELGSESLRKSTLQRTGEQSDA